MLEAVVAAHHRPREVAGGDRAAVQRRHDALAVGRHVVDAQLRRRHAVMGGRRRRHDLEQRGVDAVRPRGEEGELAPALAAVLQKRRGVLEAVAHDLAREHAARRDRLAVGGDDERDVTRLHHEHGHAHDAIAPAPDREVPARAQHPGLITGLAVERDHVAGGQLRAVALDAQTGFVRTDDAESEPRHRHHRGGDRRHDHPLLQRQQPRQPHGVSSPRAAARAPGDPRISRATPKSATWLAPRV